jgi:hypothetical protein
MSWDCLFNDKNTYAFTDFFFHVLDTITQPVLVKFPIKVKIPMSISNSAIV